MNMQQAVDDLEKLAFNLHRTAPGVKMLVLDDSVFDRRRIRRLSHDTRLGIVLDEVASIEALGPVLDQDKFDVILVDYNLPAGDGVDAVRMIRQHVLNRDCPTIMVTGDDTSEVAVKSLKSGCADYIAKDRLTVETLRNSIVGVIEPAMAARGTMLSQADIERLTAEIMAKYTHALQPKLARLIRDMRMLKAALPDPGANLPEDLERIERQCIQLWTVLLDPRTVSGGREFRH